jgi:hypothetical protein
MNYLQNSTKMLPQELNAESNFLAEIQQITKVAQVSGERYYEVKPEQISVVLLAMDNPIRKMPQEDFSIKFAQEWDVCMGAYFQLSIAEKENDFVFRECMDLMQRNHKGLSVLEFREACKQLVSGELGIEINTYGKFTAEHFSQIMAAYDRKGNIIRMAILRQRDQKTAEQEAEEKRKKAEIFSEVVSEWWRNQIFECTYKRWEDLPTGHCMELLKTLPADVTLKTDCFLLAVEQM